MIRASVFAALALVLAACSSGTTPTPAVDAGKDTSSSTDATADVAQDSATGENGCTTFVDRTATAASRDIQWDLAITSIPERCMKIKAGQTVKWAAGAAPADFATHPIVVYVPGGGGNPPTVDESTGLATFATAGTFGFACQIHGQMRGAILVE